MRLWLKTLREDRGLTMKDMGKKLCISESYYCAIENGNRKTKMDVAFIGALAGVFEIPISTAIQYEQQWFEKTSPSNIC